MVNRRVYTDRIVHASLGFTPHLSCVQVFPIDAHDEELGQLLASDTEEHRYA